MHMKQTQPEPASPIQLRAIIAAEALVDPRTVERAFRGERIQGLSRERIRMALEARGWTHLLPEHADRVVR